MLYHHFVIQCEIKTGNIKCCKIKDIVNQGIELDKAVVLVWLDWLVFCEYGFSVSALWCPLATLTILLGFLLPWCGVSLHGCSSKAQPLLRTLDEGYLLTTTVPDLQRGLAPLCPPVCAQPPLLGLLLSAVGPGLWRGWLLKVTAPGLRLKVASPGHPWPRTRGSFSWPPPMTSDMGCLLPAAAPDLGRRVAPLATTPDLWRRVAPLGLLHLVSRLAASCT